MTDPLLGGLSAADFLARHWQKAPLLIRQAIPGWSSPITPDELAGLACEEGVESRLVTRRRGKWAVRHGPFDESDFGRLPAKDWTLLVQGVDLWEPAVADLRDRFRFVPDWRLDDVMVSYAPPGGGVGAHVDQYDVFLLQGLGRRRWRIGGAAEVRPAWVPDQPLKLLAEFEPAQEWVLEPGDMLYLPPGWAHDGIAEDDCLTFSIGFRAPSVAELAGRFAAAVADAEDEERRYSDPDLAPPANPGEIPEAVIERVRAYLAEKLDDRRFLAGWLGGLLTEPKEEREAPPPRKRRPAGALRRAIGSRLAFVRDGDGLVLFADGEAHPAPAGGAAETALRLCGDGRLTAEQAKAAWADPAAAALLDALLAQGTIEPRKS
ncbi:cupin domain-containing protein [Inquilinus sp. Marseille-Q2685]|uniref:cupin domain-containing protein n=1 Tax=Inquilinus sp. Marseille-Q2685 TaxID=2866581 RepID=UPI001CE42164|nr:cupin domain-containing protein [Inquilinus sp. Marseille-Q2685]